MRHNRVQHQDFELFGSQCMILKASSLISYEVLNDAKKSLFSWLSKHSVLKKLFDKSTFLKTISCVSELRRTQRSPEIFSPRNWTPADPIRRTIFLPLRTFYEIFLHNFMNLFQCSSCRLKFISSSAHTGY